MDVALTTRSQIWAFMDKERDASPCKKTQDRANRRWLTACLNLSHLFFISLAPVGQVHVLVMGAYSCFGVVKALDLLGEEECFLLAQPLRQQLVKYAGEKVS